MNERTWPKAESDIKKNTWPQAQNLSNPDLSKILAKVRATGNRCDLHLNLDDLDFGLDFK